MEENTPPSPEPWGDDDDPSSGTWVRDMDYLSRWVEAKAATDDFYRALRDAGMDAEEIQLTASTDGRGRGVVRGWASTASLREVSRLIRRGAGLPGKDEAG